MRKIRSEGLKNIWKKNKNKKSKGIKHISKIRSGLKIYKKWKYKNESNIYKVRIKKLLIKKKKIKGQYLVEMNYYYHWVLVWI